MTLLDRAKELITLAATCPENEIGEVVLQFTQHGPALARAVVELAEALRPFAIHDDISGENTLLAVSPADMRRVRAVLRKLEEK